MFVGVAVAGAGAVVDFFAEAVAVVLHDDGEALGEGGDVGTAAAAGEADFGGVPVADEGGVQVAVAINFRAADEAEVDIACSHGAHNVEGAGSPECAVDVGGVAHGVEQFGGWGVSDDPCFKEAYAMGGVGA